MITLTATNQSVQVVLAAAPTATQATLYAAYADHTTTTFTPATSNGLSTGTTAATIVAAPAASTQRQVKYLSVFNGDSAAMTATIIFNDNGTLRTITKVTLGAGDRLEYTDGHGFQVFVADGAIRSSQQQAYTSGIVKNKIINGNFDIWQRGTSLPAAVYSARFLADRWANDGSGSTQAVSQQAFALGQTAVPNEPKYFHRTVVASASSTSNYTSVVQPIESVRTLAGSTVTLSMWVKADAPKSIFLEAEQVFGGGGSPSSSVQIPIGKFAITTSWSKIVATIAIPSISGKTLGTDNKDNIAFRVWFDAGTSFNARTSSLGSQSGTFDIAQIQIESGSLVTGFELRPASLEEQLCLRYYWQGLPWAAGVNTNFYATGAFQSFPASWPLPMRDTPTMTVTVAGWNIGGIDTSVGTSGVVLDPNRYGFRILLKSNSITPNAFLDWFNGGTATGIFFASSELL